MLESCEFNVRKWVELHLAPGFGLPCTGSLQQFNEETEGLLSDIRAELKKRKRALKKLQTVSIDKFIKTKTRAARATVKRLTKLKNAKSKKGEEYLRVVKNVKAALASGEIRGETTSEVLKYGLKHAEDALKQDYDSVLEDQLIEEESLKLKFSVEEWMTVKDNHIRANQSSIKFYEDELHKTITSKCTLLATHEELVSDLERIDHLLRRR